jgi:hypothetical protein
MIIIMPVCALSLPLPKYLSKDHFILLNYKIGRVGVIVPFFVDEKTEAQ